MKATLVKKEGQWYAKGDTETIPVKHAVPDWMDGVIGDFEIVKEDEQFHAICKTIDTYSIIATIMGSDLIENVMFGDKNNEK